MEHLKQFIASLILIFFFCSSVSAQTDSLYIAQVRSYVKYIDSINNLDEVQEKGFLKSVADGIIKRNDQIVGGYGVYTLSNLKGDTAFRIDYHDNLDINTFKAYYFKSDRLIYATLEFKSSNTQANTIFKKEEFYKDGQIILKHPEQNPSRYIDITDFSLYQDGQKFMTDFKNANNRR